MARAAESRRERLCEECGRIRISLRMVRTITGPKVLCASCRATAPIVNEPRKMRR